MVETLAATARADVSWARVEATCWGLENSSAAAAKARGESGGGETLAARKRREEIEEEEERRARFGNFVWRCAGVDLAKANEADAWAHPRQIQILEPDGAHGQ